MTDDVWKDTDDDGWVVTEDDEWLGLIPDSPTSPEDDEIVAIRGVTGRSATDYKKLLIDLLPRGRAWNRIISSVLSQLLYGKAEELARIDQRTMDLQTEREAGTSTELLSDHELDLGLPDECSELGETMVERRRAAHTKLTEVGGLNKQYYIDLLTSLGWTITIEEDPPFGWIVYFYVPDPTDWVYFVCGSSICGDPLIKVLGTTGVQCIIRKYAPAHTQVTFVYTGAAFGTGFDRSFDSLDSDDLGLLSGAFSRGFGTGFDLYHGGGEFDFNAFGDGFYKPI